jgi:hypothetical protein
MQVMPLSSDTKVDKNGSLLQAVPENSHISQFQQHDGGIASFEIKHGVPTTGTSAC